jgi:hypothetical protein
MTCHQCIYKREFHHINNQIDSEVYKSKDILPNNFENDDVNLILIVILY